MADLASRITNPNEGAPPADAAPADVTAGDAPAADDQVDGAKDSGLTEVEFDVEVSLSDLQANAATPFHSATQWTDLGL